MMGICPVEVARQIGADRLQVTLLSLAIADDIGAVIVIAAFYSSGLNWFALLLAAFGFALVRMLSEAGVRGTTPLPRPAVTAGAEARPPPPRCRRTCCSRAGGCSR
jgi:hypothetical protein